jgi:hypothetical protein
MMTMTELRQKAPTTTELRRWYRRRKFLTAVKILETEAERHGADGHDMNFVVVNESYLTMVCTNCPDHQHPLDGMTTATSATAGTPAAVHDYDYESPPDGVA